MLYLLIISDTVFNLNKLDSSGWNYAFLVFFFFYFNKLIFTYDQKCNLISEP